MAMRVVILRIPNTMVGKAATPYLRVRSKLRFYTVRESALDELNRPFQRAGWRNEQMKMIGHQDKFVQQIGLAPIVKQNLEKQSRPSLGAK